MAGQIEKGVSGMDSSYGSAVNYIPCCFARKMLIITCLYSLFLWLMDYDEKYMYGNKKTDTKCICQLMIFMVGDEYLYFATEQVLR
jgi:hypothetical protein